jgi:hypothetical protein
MTNEQLERIIASNDIDLISSTARLLLVALKEAEAEILDLQK